MSHKDRPLFLSLCHVETNRMEILMPYLSICLFYNHVIAQSPDPAELCMFPESKHREPWRTMLATDVDVCTISQKLSRSFQLIEVFIHFFLLKGRKTIILFFICQVRHSTTCTLLRNYKMCRSQNNKIKFTNTSSFSKKKIMIKEVGIFFSPGLLFLCSFKMGSYCTCYFGI